MDDPEYFVKRARFVAIASLIFCGGGGYLLYSNWERIGFWPYLFICAAIVAACLLLAWLLDKKAGRL